MQLPPADLSDPSRSLPEPDSLGADDIMALDVDLAMPLTDKDALEQEDRVYTPPPRVAARFYRPSQARRKDSAASSRRNSISSAHSRCSSIQCSTSRDDNQSKYVAQHFRRASFLEHRRARLADRAAHAEKVRLRAAVAKAAPRGHPSSEERALAAQQARERNLAEIVANCAEEVRKAKQVAELTKEKREQEMIQMRAKMEERLVEAERRREELRNKPPAARSRGLSLVARKPVAFDLMPQLKENEKPAMDADAAAARIQGWWRGRVRGQFIHQFNVLGLSVDGIRDTSFDDVVELLARQKVLTITARLLRICGLEEGDSGSVEEMAAVRTFLSAFLILGHPNQVLGNKLDADEAADASAHHGADPLAAHRLPSADLANPQLQDLIRKAKDLLIVFENMLLRLTSWNRYTMPPMLKKTLPEAYAVFYNAFIAWKSRDSNALVEVMLMQLVELDAILQTVKEDTTGDAAASALYRQSIQDRQLMLIMRIKNLAGAERGKNMIFKAVNESRRMRHGKKQTGDTKPREAENASGEASATASSLVLVSDEAGAEKQPTTAVLALASATSSEPASALASASRSGDAARPAVARTGLNGLLPDNQVVVHELAINKEYQIPWEDYVEEQAVLARPLYAQMRAALANGDADLNSRIFTLMAGNMREKLQRPLKPGNSMYKLIGEILDPDLAVRQFNVGSFSYEKFFAAMGSLLLKLCAPFRDDEVNELVQSRFGDGDVMDRVEALNRFIDVILCDYINYMLRIAAPQLMESAAQYEAKRFAAAIADGGPAGLVAAEAAWRSARRKVMAEVQRRDPEGIGHVWSQPTAAWFYAQMLVDVFTQPTPIAPAQVPEMLRLDLGRINDVSTTVQRIITVGAVLLQCKNLLKRDVRTQWKTEAARIMAVLKAHQQTPAPLAATVDGTMAALEAGRCMPAATKTHLRALVTKVLTAGRDMAWGGGAEPREPVLRLLLTRLRGNILARLAPGSAGEKVRAANTAGEKLASLGLSEFVDRVRHMCDLLDKVGAVDRAAHSPWWDAVAAKVQHEEESAAAESGAR